MTGPHAQAGLEAGGEGVLEHSLEVVVVEAEAVGQNGNGAHSARSIGDARGRLLQAARQMAEKTGRRVANIIADASEGKLSLEGLRDLTDADVTLVSAAMARISNGGSL